MLRDAQAEKAYADAAKSRAELAGWMPPQPLPPPEAVLMPPPAQPMPPQGMPEPDMDQQGGPSDFDADNMMQGGGGMPMQPQMPA